MSNQPKAGWSDILQMIKLRLLELLDAIAILGALVGLVLLAISMTGAGFLIGADIALPAIAFAVIPNVLAQAAHRLYDD